MKATNQSVNNLSIVGLTLQWLDIYQLLSVMMWCCHWSH